MEIDYFYNELSYVMINGCNNLYKYIELEGNKPSNNNYRYIYTLFYECFKNIESVLILIKNNSFTQCAILLRTAMEQLSIIEVLLNNKQLIELYNKFATNRYKALQDDKNISQSGNNWLEQAYKNRTNKNTKRNNYDSFGWIEKIVDDRELININTIFNKANLSDFIEWHKFYDKFVHNTISKNDFSNLGLQYYSRDFIYKSAVIYDHLICDYHNLNYFAFKIDGIDYSSNYKLSFIKITDYLSRTQKVDIVGD